MDVLEKTLYSELRTTRNELLKSLKEGKGSPLIKPFIEAELKDIECTIQKMERGNFGVCELSGEFIPAAILLNIPTIQNMDDYKKMDSYYRKGLYE